MLSRDIDPVKFELIKKSLSFVVDDMALTVIRSAYSGIIKDNMDFSTAICDERGQMVAQGLALVQFGSIPDAMEAVLKHYQGRIYVEDIVLNDPFDGGTHLPDIFLLKPIFIDDRLEFFSAVVGHHLDVGGRVAGGNACDSTEVFQEGLRIGPLKFYERGIPNQTLISLIGTNVRKPRTMPPV